MVLRASVIGRGGGRAWLGACVPEGYVWLSGACVARGRHAYGWQADGYASYWSAVLFVLVFVRHPFIHVI